MKGVFGVGPIDGYFGVLSDLGYGIRTGRVFVKNRTLAELYGRGRCVELLGEWGEMGRSLGMGRGI